MKAYLDSTKRRFGWDAAFPEITDVFGLAGELPAQTTHVFLHESDLHIGTPDGEYAGALLHPLHEGRGLEGDENAQAANRAVALRGHLRRIKDKANAPWLIIYSGTNLEQNQRAELSGALSRCLLGYPRIRCIETGIPREIVIGANNALRDLINRFVFALAQREVLDPNVALAKERLQIEWCLALRLLCEAWLLTHWSQAKDYTNKQALKEALRLNGDQPELPPDIPLCAADKQQEWLEPFGLGRDGFVAQMPDHTSRVAASKFFESISNHSPTFGQVADLLLALSASLSPMGGTP